MTPIDKIKKIIATYIPADSLRARFAKGVFWSFAGAAISQGLNLLAFVLVARLLNLSQFGELGIIQSTVGMFGTLAGFGLGVMATRYIAENRKTDPLRTGQIISIASLTACISGMIIAIIFYFLAPYLACHTLNAPHLINELRIGCGLLFFNSLGMTLAGGLAGFEAFRTIANCNLIAGILNFPVVVLGTYLLGLKGTVAAMVITSIVTSILNGRALRREMRRESIPVIYSNIFKELPILWTFAMPSFMSGALVTPVIWFANTILVRSPSGYGELGIYNAASKSQALLNLVGTVLGSTFLPILASKEGHSNELFQRTNILLSWLLGILPAIPLICFPELLGLLFGDQYKGTVPNRTLVLVMCAASVILYKQGLSRVLVAQNLMWWGLLSNVVWAAVLIPCVFLFRPWGAVGFAASFVIAYVVNTFVFIPLYTLRNLVPKNTLVSSEAIMIWGVIFALSSMTFLNAGIITRTASMVISLVILYLCFKRMLFSKNNLE